MSEGNKCSQLENFINVHFKYKHWPKDLIERISDVTQKGVIDYLQIIKQIGEDDFQVEEWNTVFINQVKLTYQDLITDAQKMKEKLLDKIEVLVQKQTVLCRNLQINERSPNFDDMTLYEVINFLKNKIDEYEVTFDTRLKEIEILCELQTVICKILGKEKKIIPRIPLPTVEQVEEFRKCIDELEQEKFKREEQFMKLRTRIIEIVNDLKYVPNLDFERQLINLPDLNVMITDSDMDQLDLFFTKLIKEQEEVKEKIHNLKRNIYDLWDKLEITVIERDNFLKTHNDESYDTLNALVEELKRLEELKRANIHVFMEKLKNDLQSYWDKCYVTEEEREKFTYFNTDICNEDILCLFELEIAKWTSYYSEHKILFDNLKEHTEVWRHLKELDLKAECPNRYQNRGGQLLREEKERNKYQKRLIFIEEVLYRFARNYRNEHKKEYLIEKLTIDQYIQKCYDDLDKERRLRLSAKKQERDLKDLTKLTPAKSCMNLFPSMNSINTRTITQSAPPKRKPLTQLGDNEHSNKKTKITLSSKKFDSKSTIKINTLKRRQSQDRKKRLDKKRLSSMKICKSKSNTSSSSEAEYNDFENEISKKGACRSSTIHDVLAVPLPKTPICVNDNQNQGTSSSSSSSKSMNKRNIHTFNLRSKNTPTSR